MSDAAFLSTVAQLLGVLLIAVFLWPFTRVVRARFLVYWAWGWTLLALSLVALFVSTRLPTGPPVSAARSAYCLLQYGFAFLVWAGCRDVLTGRPLRRADALPAAPAAAFGLAAPWLTPSLPTLYGWHAAVMVVFLVAAFGETLRRTPPDGPTPGLRVFQAFLLGLAALLLHYAGLIGWMAVSGGQMRPGYMLYSSLYDLFWQAGLAFGMATMATERLRAELQAANDQLAAAVAELEQASRTDPLTGLLNRRGLDDLLARPDAVPAGVLAVIDVTDLKPLNDRLGHAAGDVALQLVARGLRTLFRVTDPIVRTGGDEFLVLMPGGTADELARRMEALDRTLLGQRLLPHPDPTDLKVAWGISGYADPAAVPDAITRADTAMYDQKRTRKGDSDRGRAT